MKKSNDTYVAIFLFFLCAIGVYGTLTTDTPMTGEQINSLALPWFSIAGCALCAICLLWRSIFTNQNSPLSIKTSMKTLIYATLFALYLTSMIFLSNYFTHATSIEYIHGSVFLITSILFGCISMYALGQRNWYKILANCIIIVGSLMVIFKHFFHILLP